MAARRNRLRAILTTAILLPASLKQAQAIIHSATLTIINIVHLNINNKQRRVNIRVTKIFHIDS